MVMCWAPDCKHYNVRDKCKFFRFPRDTKERKRWEKLLRRDVKPGPGAFVCSCHFRDGKKENGPELFIHNVKKRLEFPTPEKKRRRTRLTPSEDVTTEQQVVDIDVLPSTSSEPQPSTSGTQVVQSSIELEVDNYFLRQKLESYESSEQRFSYIQIQDKDELITLYTGLPDNKVFMALFNLIKNVDINYYMGWNVEKLSKQDQLLMCLMKLRQNFPHLDLAHRFKVSQAIVSNVVYTWIHVLHEILYKQFMSSVPSRRKNKSCLPNCFSTFTNCRIVIDCTEMATTVSRTSMDAQKATYSAYKHKNTWKALIGVAPNGVITYASALYPGSTSDRKIVQHCGVLKCMEPGDLILADKGFLIRDLVPAGVHVNIPPFLDTPQFTQAQVFQTERFARARIHIERAIRRMKTFQIINFVPYNLLRHADAILQVIAALTNLKNPLIKEVEDKYSDQSEQSESD